MDRADQWPPKESLLRKPLRYMVQCYHVPIVHWLVLRAIYPVVIVGGLFGWLAALTSASLAAQFLIGFENPFSPPKDLDLSPTEQNLAVALRLVGWIIVPALVGSAAGTLAGEQLGRLFNRELDVLIEADEE
ncbi:hypothetical protein [Streptomyces sanyensis]